MTKKHTIDEALVAGLLLSLLVCMSFYIPLSGTGKTTMPELNVSIREKLDIEFTVFDFLGAISIIDNQNITVEVTNTGSTGYNATLTVLVYNLTNLTHLNLMSTYVDSTVVLHPGNTRGQKYIFAPSEEGNYFVKGSVRYGTRVKEIWGSFNVVGFPQPQEPPPSNQTNQTNQTPSEQPPPSSGGGGGGSGGGSNVTSNVTSNQTISITPPTPSTANVTSRNPSTALDYPERIIVYKNITSLLGIKITNDGDTTISGLIMYVSTPIYFSTDVNPKAQQTLVKNQSVTYLISLFTSDAPVGEYTLEFKTISGQLVKQGNVIIDVRESPESLKDLIYLRILNYEFLLNGISSEASGLGSRGYDVSMPFKFITAADEGLELARGYYDEGEYVKAFGVLLDVEQNIRTAVFALGNVQVKLYAVQRADYYLLIFAVPFILLFIIIYRRRKDRRPKLLREAKEE